MSDSVAETIRALKDFANSNVKDTVPSCSIVKEKDLMSGHRKTDAGLLPFDKVLEIYNACFKEKKLVGLHQRRE